MRRILIEIDRGNSAEVTVAYSLKVIVYASDNPKVEESVRAAMEFDGSTISEFSTKSLGQGEKEFYAELEFGNRRLADRIIRRVEAVVGAAVMAATEPKEIRPRKTPEG